MLGTIVMLIGSPEQTIGASAYWIQRTDKDVVAINRLPPKGKAVFDGEISISSTTRRPVLSSILFSAVEIADFACSKMQGFTGKVHSLEEAAQLLKTNLMETYFLANKGLLNAKRAMEAPAGEPVEA